MHQHHTGALRLDCLCQLAAENSAQAAAHTTQTSGAGLHSEEGAIRRCVLTESTRSRILSVCVSPVWSGVSLHFFCGKGEEVYIHSIFEDLKRRTESVHDLQVTAGIEFLLIAYMLVVGAKK